VFSFDVDGFGVGGAVGEREIHIEVIFIFDFDVHQFLAFLQQDRRVERLFNFLLVLQEELHLDVYGHHFIGVDIHCMEDLFLHCKNVEVAEGLQVPLVVCGGVGELGEN
jgi:hypothetical protein